MLVNEASDFILIIVVSNSRQQRPGTVQAGGVPTVVSNTFYALGRDKREVCTWWPPMYCHGMRMFLSPALKYFSVKALYITLIKFKVSVC